MTNFRFSEALFAESGLASLELIDATLVCHGREMRAAVTSSMRPR